MPLHHTLLTELGLHSLHNSAPSTKLIILQRFIRFFAFGGSTIVLALYLHTLSIPDSRIGLFFSLTLVGDVLSFALALFADGIGRRIVLAGGAGLMVFSGVVFASTGSFWWLLLASVVGIISPNGREIGPFSAIEESTIAHLTSPEIRSDIFAWYTVIGSAGSAAGKLATGWVVQYLQDSRAWTPVRSYRAVFIVYAALGALNLFLCFFLGKKVELHDEPVSKRKTGPEEEDPLLSDNDNESTKRNDEERNSNYSLLPRISKESRGILFKLCILFAIDSVASGLVPASLVTYFFHLKFLLEPASLGTIFSIMGLLSAISSLIAASLSRRIGLIKTMVFTHLPSAIALALIPIPSSLPLSLLFLIIRSSLASMDIAPKAAFLSVVVKAEERTAVMGFISVVRTASQSLGPVVTGVLAQNGRFWVTFVVAGALKATYDVGLLVGFRGHKADRDRVDERTEREVEREVEEEEMND